MFTYCFENETTYVIDTKRASNGYNISNEHTRLFAHSRAHERKLGHIFDTHTHIRPSHTNTKRHKQLSASIQSRSAVRRATIHADAPASAGELRYRESAARRRRAPQSIRSVRPAPACRRVRRATAVTRTTSASLQVGAHKPPLPPPPSDTNSNTTELARVSFHHISLIHNQYSN